MDNRKLLKNRKLLNILAIGGVIAVAAVLRLVPHLPNFAPIGALALFAGFHLKSYKAYIFPLGAMLLSDMFLGFHETIFFVYGSFLLILFIGRYMGNIKLEKVVGASLLASVLFFVVTNFGVWLVMDLYPKNFAGLMQSYNMAIPFFRNTLSGDMIYSLSFFYGFYGVQALYGQKAASVHKNVQKI